MDSFFLGVSFVANSLRKGLCFVRELRKSRHDAGHGSGASACFRFATLLWLMLKVFGIFIRGTVVFTHSQKCVHGDLLLGPLQRYHCSVQVSMHIDLFQLARYFSFRDVPVSRKYPMGGQH